MVSSVDQEFGNVDGMDTMLKLLGCRKDDLMHAGHNVGKILINIEFFLDIIGIQYRLLRHLY